MKSYILARPHYNVRWLNCSAPNSRDGMQKENILVSLYIPLSANSTSDVNSLRMVSFPKPNKPAPTYVQQDSASHSSRGR